ncbi:transposase, partial [bacterium]|nr:transposase [bacterium]
PGEVNPVTNERVTVRWLLRVAFGRWSIESVFREGKEELGLDHWEVRGWRCVHRHFFVTALSHLFCARMRAEFNASPDTSVRVTLLAANCSGEPDVVRCRAAARPDSDWLVEGAVSRADCQRLGTAERAAR